MTEKELDNLYKKLKELEHENSILKDKLFHSRKQTVTVPEPFKEIFDQAEELVADYFTEFKRNPEKADIEINGERYILIRSASLSYEFLDIIKELYKDEGIEHAQSIGHNFLFDISSVIGQKDAKAFHKKMKLDDPISKLSAGPVHFAYTGWANVELFPECNPSPDENYYLKYIHHNSFEAQAWINAKRKSTIPVCTMNAGYSSGWCSESFGIPLTAVEISCQAKGDKNCVFVMAPTNRIEEYVSKEAIGEESDYRVPVFFERKVNEDKLKRSLEQKENLLREVHHRVKNNLQIISSLIKLQLNTVEDPATKAVLSSSLTRISTMAQVHELIYIDEDLEFVNIEMYFKQIANALYHLYHNSQKTVEVNYEIDLDDPRVTPDIAIPLGMVLNEIASNAFKYAFKNIQKGVFSVKLRARNKKWFIQLSDNGSGYDENQKKNTLGQSLIPILCEQIDAEVEMKNTLNGLSYTIQFQVP